MSQTPVHPLATMKDEWMLSHRKINATGLLVQQNLFPPDEIESPPMTHHMLCLMLSPLTSRYTVRIDGQEYDGARRKGDLWLLPADCPTFLRWERKEIINFMIEPASLDRIAVENDYPHSNQIELPSFVYRQDPQILFLASMFQKEMQNGGLGSELYLDSLANLFNIYFLRHYTNIRQNFRSYSGGLSRIDLQEVVEYIHAHLDRSLKLADLAAIANISQYHFARLFKQSTGMTPHQYVLQQRVERAKELFKNKKLTINEVAHQCGFSHQSHLSYHFRRAFGTSPKQFQRQ